MPTKANKFGSSGFIVEIFKVLDYDNFCKMDYFDFYHAKPQRTQRRREEG